MPNFANIWLVTNRLILRPLGVADAQALFVLFSDPETMRYWSTGPWSSVEQADELIAKDAKALAEGANLRLAVVCADDQRLIGVCTFFAFSAQNRHAEIGYIQSRDAWGLGFMHEALTALVTHGFEHLNLNRIEADVDPRNLPSARGLERLGFRKEGHFREGWIIVVGESVASNAAAFVAVDGAQVVGWCDIFPEWAQATQHCGSLGMGVLAAYRGQGIGRALLARCIAKARANDITRIQLEVRADNHAAIHLYEKVGFVLEACKRNAMRFDGVYFDALQMSLFHEPGP